MGNLPHRHSSSSTAKSSRSRRYVALVLGALLVFLSVLSLYGGQHQLKPLRAYQQRATTDTARLLKQAPSVSEKNSLGTKISEKANGSLGPNATSKAKETSDNMTVVAQDRSSSAVEQQEDGGPANVEEVRSNPSTGESVNDFTEDDSPENSSTTTNGYSAEQDDQAQREDNEVETQQAASQPNITTTMAIDEAPNYTASTNESLKEEDPEQKDVQETEMTIEESSQSSKAIPDLHHSNIAFLELQPWEKDSILNPEKIPSSIPEFCALGTVSNSGVLRQASGCGSSNYDKVQEQLLDYLPEDGICDICRIVDIARDKNLKTIALLGDSVMLQTLAA